MNELDVVKTAEDHPRPSPLHHVLTWVSLHRGAIVVGVGFVAALCSIFGISLFDVTVFPGDQHEPAPALTEVPVDNVTAEPSNAVPCRYGWGPDRTMCSMDTPASIITFNSIFDNNAVGDERNFNVIREVGNSEWLDSVEILPGREYEIRLVIHNNAADNLGLVAHEVRLSLNLPRNTSITQFCAWAFVSSPDASPQTIWNGIRLYSDIPFYVDVVSARYFNNVTGPWDGSRDPELGFDIPDLFVEHGALVGYKQLDGDVPGGLKYSGYAIIRIKPVFS